MATVDEHRRDQRIKYLTSIGVTGDLLNRIAGYYSDAKYLIAIWMIAKECLAKSMKVSVKDGDNAT